MRAHRSTRWEWQESVRRVAADVFVITIHLGAWWLFFRAGVPPWPSPQTRAEQRLDSLSLRLIPPPTRPPALTSPPARRIPRERPQLRDKPRAALATRVAQLPTAPTPQVATTLSIAPPDGYIPGGSLLHGVGRNSPPAVRLPGSGTPIVKGFHLANPRTQGIAGVARALQSLFGVPDKHCVDVDAWRGLTVQEQLARHISMARIERTAEEYRCLPHQHDPWLQ